MRSRLSIAILLLSTALAGEKHSAAVKAKLKEAEKAEKAGDLAGARRLLEEAQREEPRPIGILESLAGIARQECSRPMSKGKRVRVAFRMTLGE